jgi:hypothetical protein
MYSNVHVGYTHWECIGTVFYQNSTLDQNSIVYIRSKKYLKKWMQHAQVHEEINKYPAKKVTTQHIRKRS